jgi:hypothetical protein
MINAHRTFAWVCGTLPIGTYGPPPDAWRLTADTAGPRSSNNSVMPVEHPAIKMGDLITARPIAHASCARMDGKRPTLRRATMPVGSAI